MFDDPGNVSSDFQWSEEEKLLVELLEEIKPKTQTKEDFIVELLIAIIQSHTEEKKSLVKIVDELKLINLSLSTIESYILPYLQENNMIVNS